MEIRSHHNNYLHVVEELISNRYRALTPTDFILINPLVATSVYPKIKKLMQIDCSQSAQNLTKFLRIEPDCRGRYRIQDCLILFPLVEFKISPVGVDLITEY